MAWSKIKSVTVIIDPQLDIDETTAQSFQKSGYMVLRPKCLLTFDEVLKTELKKENEMVFVFASEASHIFIRSSLRHVEPKLHVQEQIRDGYHQLLYTRQLTNEGVA